MRLFEHEGKELFEEYGIVVPKGELVHEAGEEFVDMSLTVVKAQVLSGKRGKRGLVKVVEDREAAQALVGELLGQEVDGEKVEKVLVEEAVEIANEYFVSITYSTKTRGPVLLLSSEGGVEVEDASGVVELELEFGVDVPSVGVLFKDFDKIAVAEDLDERKREVVEQKVWDTVNKLWKLFQEKDLFLAEINPLVVTKGGEVVALDAKVVTDDAAEFRQKWELPERNMLGTAKSGAELAAEEIDRDDHRGVVGRVYLDLPGDVGVLAAGGGASLVAMDALVGYGMKPANYTEFSGNPPGYKVKRLAEIVMEKDLSGLMLVGGKANFTDQVETLSGFLEALVEAKPKYPVVVRRDGPGMEEAKAMLEKARDEHGLELHVYDASVPIVEAVKKLTEFISAS